MEESLSCHEEDKKWSAITRYAHSSQAYGIILGEITSPSQGYGIILGVITSSSQGDGIIRGVITSSATILFLQERIQSLEKQLGEANKQLTKLEVLEQVSQAELYILYVFRQQRSFVVDYFIHFFYAIGRFFKLPCCVS